MSNGGYSMENLKIEQAIRAWGASGLYQGFWPLIEMIGQMKEGMVFRVAMRKTAEKWGISTVAMRKRICTLLLSMEREQTEAFVEDFSDVDLKPKKIVERMVSLI